MSHYFLNDTELDHKLVKYDVQIQGTSFRFFTDRGVFSRESLDYGTRFLLENIPIENHVKTIIDMGCGYGPMGLFLAKVNPEIQVFLYDINERALQLAGMNQKENKIQNVTINKSFLFDDVPFQVDMIVTNPPIRAGKQVVFKLYEQAFEHLNSKGVFVCVIQKKQGALSTVKKIESLFDNCQILRKSKGYWLVFAQKGIL
ncbi:MAG: class I SAM-dependent methyltransferase [Acholeplasmataceae bacterium]|nr:class I SAM-dependent methyltransferase [Acholeplasmataceae bacterium]